MLKLKAQELSQLQKNIFRFPLVVDMKGTGKKEKISITGGTSSFRIKTDKKPTSIIIDPDTELLMTGTVKEKQ